MQFFEANDGGVMRSSGDFVDRSAWCTGPPNRGLSGDALARCQQMLSRIPSTLEGINKGLPTLQFQSLSVSPHNKNAAAGRHAGQRHVGDARQPGQVGEHDDRRRRPVGLRRRDARVPLPHVLRRVTGRELLGRRHRRLELDRRSDLRHRRPVLRADHHRPGGVADDVRRHDQRPADEDARHGDDDARRVPAALQRVDGRLRRPVR